MDLRAEGRLKAFACFLGQRTFVILGGEVEHPFQLGPPVAPGQIDRPAKLLRRRDVHCGIADEIGPRRQGRRQRIRRRAPPDGQNADAVPMDQIGGDLGADAAGPAADQV